MQQQVPVDVGVRACFPGKRQSASVACLQTRDGVHAQSLAGEEEEERNEESDSEAARPAAASKSRGKKAAAAAAIQLLLPLLRQADRRVSPHDRREEPRAFGGDEEAVRGESEEEDSD